MLTLLKVYNFKPKNQSTYVHRHKFKHNFITAQGHITHFDKSKLMFTPKHKLYVKHEAFVKYHLSDSEQQ